MKIAAGTRRSRLICYYRLGGRKRDGEGGGEREGEREGEKTDLFGGHLAFSQFRRLSMPIDVIRTKRGGYCESVFRRNA